MHSYDCHSYLEFSRTFSLLVNLDDYLRSDVHPCLGISIEISGSLITLFCRLCGFLLVIQFGPPLTVHMIIYLLGMFF